MQQSMKDIGQVPSIDNPSTNSCIEDDIYERNYLTGQSGAQIYYVVKQKAQQTIASQRQKQPQEEHVEVSAANLLSDDDRKLWLSSLRNSNFPQTLLIDLTSASYKGRSNVKEFFFSAIGFRCWHAYTTNPETIKISLSSSDKKNFVPWQTFHLEQKAGTQICSLRERVRAKSLKFIKLEILSTFTTINSLESADQQATRAIVQRKNSYTSKHQQPSQQTYLNQIMLYSERPGHKPGHSQVNHTLFSNFAPAPSNQNEQLENMLYKRKSSAEDDASYQKHVFGVRASQTSVMPSAISCNISQQPDLNLMIEDDGGFVYDTSFQFPPTTTVSNNTNNVAALSVKQRRTAQ